MRPRFDKWRAAALTAAVASVSLFRYLTGPAPTLAHELSLRLYYIPILVAAYWYGVAGGLLIAFISSVAYINHVWEAVSIFDPSRVAEVVIFHLIGACVGLLSSAQRRATARYRSAAATLEHANAELRSSHEEMARVDRLRMLGEVATGQSS